MNYLKTFLPHIFGNKKGKSFVLPAILEWDKLSFEEKLMFHTLRNDIETFIDTLVVSDLTTQQIYHLLSFREHLTTEFLNDIIGHYPFEYRTFNSAINGVVLNKVQVQEILNHQTYKLSLIAIFQKDRSIPGRLFIRRADGSFVHKNNGDLWSMKVLGTSGRGLPFNHSNGLTPCGVYSVDSVMPEANKNADFGKFRRLIVNFLATSPNEENIKQFLPRNQHSNAWWLPSIVGRELGRSLLRIHGTGRVNINPFSSYFPMIPSSGCLTTIETTAFGLCEVNDQRDLLDTLMAALNLPIAYENESKIHGLLYVIEFDDTYQALEFRS
ncbi:MAG: hypothetical protein H7336_07100 [Bacteriovorax sp.]|nr:hypothetical protein [Bacteriovorax sp.]